MATAAPWGTTISMHTDLLRLVQWLSPSFPTGGFAYSHGLEWAIASGEVGRRDVGGWIGQVLRYGAGWSDAVILAHTLRGADLRDMARALAPSAERLHEAEAQGAAFAATVRALGLDVPDAPLPVAVGWAACTLELPPETVVGVYLHAFASNLCSCATRFVPLGQNEGQGVLASLHPLIADVAARAAQAGLDDIETSAFRGDLASMLHETLDVRIFRT